jgi:two-component system, LuxR family, sensor kinase FixL
MATDDPAQQEESANTSPHPEKPSILLSQAAIASLPYAVAILDAQGELVLTNKAWKELQQEVRLWETHGRGGFTFDIGEFQKVCPEARSVYSGIAKVVLGILPKFIAEFHLKTPERRRWFNLRAEPLESTGHFMLTLTDTTRQHKTEQDLRESHSLFHRIVEGTGDAVFIYDTLGHFLMHNAAFVELIPNQRGKLVGKSIEEVFPPNLSQTMRSHNEVVLGTGRTVGYEIVLEHPGGNRTLLIQKGLYRNHRGQVVGIIGISRDITERKLAEEKLERSEHHFRALIEKSNDTIGIISEQGDVIYVSPQVERMFGFDTGHWIGANIFFWIHPDEEKMVREHLEQTRSHPGNSVTTEMRLLCKDGSWRWVEATASNHLDDPGVQAIIVNIRDISERKQTEQDLQRFQAIVESSIDAIFSTDPTGVITSWNPAARHIFGYTEQEMLGGNVTQLIPRDRVKENRGFTATVLKGKAVHDVETVRVAKDGRRIDVSLTLSPIYNSTERISGIAAILRDITDRRRLEKEVLEISDFEKQRIGQDLHDDLCQHLVGVAMLCSILERDLRQYGLKQAEDAAQIKTMVNTAIDQARSLARGLSPLDFSHGGLIAGLQALVTNTERIFRIPCEFVCHAPVQLQNHEVATHLFRITQEAVHNAVKHSKGTKVVVLVEQHEADLVITVDDNGVGIPDAPKPSTNGSGLGMHTMRYRARVIGAMLCTAHKPEGGSKVICRFRLPEPDGKEA